LVDVTDALLVEETVVVPTEVLETVVVAEFVLETVLVRVCEGDPVVVFDTVGEREDVAVTDDDLVDDKVGVSVALVDDEGVVETVLEDETVADTVDVAIGDLDDDREASGLTEAELDTELDFVPDVEGVDVTETESLAVDVGDRVDETLDEPLGLPLGLPELEMLPVDVLDANEERDTEGEDVVVLDDIDDAELLGVTSGVFVLVTD
jgi:hypothetical protein